jgi:hypothetical protein
MDKPVTFCLSIARDQGAILSSISLNIWATKDLRDSIQDQSCENENMQLSQFICEEIKKKITPQMVFGLVKFGVQNEPK